MFYLLLAILAFGFLIVLKIAKGILKLVLIIILIALIAGTFAGKDRIDSAPAGAETAL